MEAGHQSESFNTVFNCVIPYIHNGAVRNSVSLVCRGWYELDCVTRKHVTVHVTYCPEPSRLVQRFPFLESLTLKGFTKVPHDDDDDDDHHKQIEPWIQEIAVSFKHLKSLHIRHFLVHDSDLDLLARTRGKDLRVLMINKCEGFSPLGLIPIGKYCTHLKTLMLERNRMLPNSKDGNWLHELALSNTVIESFSYDSTLFSPADVKSLILLAKNCSQTLVSLKIPHCYRISDLRDVFSHAVRLEKFVGSYADREYSGFRFPPSIHYLGIGIHQFCVTSLPFVLPLANQLRELNFRYGAINLDNLCILIQRCPNLEVLNFGCSSCKDRDLQVIGQFCKKLRKLTYYSGSVNRMGLIAVAKGCPDIEYLHISVRAIQNVVLECIGHHLKNLRDFSIRTQANFVSGDQKKPLDKGIQKILNNCTQLERLGIDLYSRDLTDVGLEYIGKYGHNLRYLCLSLPYTQEAAYAGLVELLKGCPKLRKLELKGGDFGNQALVTSMNNLHFLRYASILHHKSDHFVIEAMSRPSSNL